MRVTGSNDRFDIEELMAEVDAVENTYGRVDDFVNVGVRDAYEEELKEEERY